MTLESAMRELSSTLENLLPQLAAYGQILDNLQSQPTAPISVLEAALGYARSGRSVIPIWGIADGQCECCKGVNCRNAGKHPIEPNWQTRPAKSPSEVRKTWSKWPNANVALVCGASGIAVIDVDPRNSGDRTLRDLERTHGSLPRMLVQLTGGGGRHFLFRAPDRRLPAKLGPGVDLKHGNGFIVVWPSMHLSGRRYCWADGLDPNLPVSALPDLPSWVVRDTSETRDLGDRSVDERTASDRDLVRAKAALSVLDADDYGVWMRQLFAVHHATGGSEEGFQIIDTWSQASPKYDADELRTKWESVNETADPVRLASLFYDAKLAGWEEPVDVTGNGKTSTADAVIDAVLERGAVLWRDADMEGYCSLPEGSTWSRWKLGSRKFEFVVREIFGTRHQSGTASKRRPASISDKVLKEAIAGLQAIAIGGEVRAPQTRVLGNAERIWIDLGDENWTVISVDRHGWAVCKKDDVPLVRSSSMRALPSPKAMPGILSEFRNLLNLGNSEQDDDFRLIVAWLVSVFWPTGPYCILAIDGEQGSGKSTTARLLRRLVDPNKADLRAMPKKEDDLLIAAQHSRVIAFDNVSSINADLADAICRIATGGGIGKRQLWTDGEEHVMSVSRPVLLNGIPFLLSRSDLSERSIAISLPTIGDQKRRPESEIMADFDRIAPGVLAALLDAVSVAQTRLPDVRLARLPRMADFARLACAFAPAFGWTETDMMHAIELNRTSAVEGVLESDSAAIAVTQLLADKGSWCGTASELLDILPDYVSGDPSRTPGWPSTPQQVSNFLKRVSPTLRRSGVEVTSERKASKRLIRLTRTIDPLEGL